MSEQVAAQNRIDEITMMKGLGITFVVLVHMSSITGFFKMFEHVLKINTSIDVPIMMLFFFASGYTTRPKDSGVIKTLGNKISRILIPYYKFAAAFIAVHAVIYLLIERKSLAWFVDGTLGILFQLQSFHFFDAASSGIHLMFYSVIIGWFVFQMAISEILFLPLLNVLKDKNRVWKIVTAFILLLAGAILYKLNLQGLNGKFFPPVCKMFILPNIPGLAGLMMLGNCTADIGLLEFDSFTAAKKALSALASIAVIVLFIITDDYQYDFPIGKWGAFGAYSYFLSPVYGLALLVLLAIICNLVKQFDLVKRYLIYMGNNSMDFLNLHFFVGFLAAYIGGFWYDYLNEPMPSFDFHVVLLHYVILIISVYVVSCAVIAFKNRRMKGD